MAECVEFYNDYMRVGDLKNTIKDLPDDMIVVIPIVDEDNVNTIFAFRKVRTAGILTCEEDPDPEVLCLNGAKGDQDIADQIHFSDLDVGVKDVLYGRKRDVSET